MDSDGRVTSEEYGTTDDDVMDKPGETCITDILVPQQPQTVPSEPARLAAEAVMRTTFPTIDCRDEPGLGAVNNRRPSR